MSELSDRFTFPEMMRALHLIGAKDSAVTGWIHRGQVYGIPKDGPGPGGRRVYSLLGVLSLALQHQLTQLGFAADTAARLIVPDIWRQLAADPKCLDYIWAVEATDAHGKIWHVILSDSDDPKLKGATILRKWDLAVALERVLTELEQIKTERPADSLLPRSEFAATVEKGAIYGLFQSRAAQS